MPTAYVNPSISDERSRTRVRVDPWIPVVAVIALVVIALFASKLAPGPFVSRVTFVNQSEYSIDVEVAGANGHGWTLLGTAKDHASSAVAAVFDEGSRWTFRFQTQGRVIGTTTLGRGDLERNGWQVTVPDGFIAQLRNAGVVPTP